MRSVSWRRTTAAMLVSTLTVGTTSRGIPATPTPLREGKCAGADELFPDHNPGPGSLKAIAVPEPTELSTYVRNRQAAVVLGNWAGEGEGIAADADTKKGGADGAGAETGC